MLKALAVLLLLSSLLFSSIIIAPAASSASVFTPPPPPTNIKVVMGERYFPNGTGTAFINDGTTLRFSHQVTPRNGYYYDNSTVFLAGLIPGFTKNFITINPSLDEIANRSANDRFSYTPFYDDNSNVDGIMNTSSSNAPLIATSLKLEFLTALLSSQAPNCCNQKFKNATGTIIVEER